MKRSTRRFERLIIRKRNRLEKRGQRLAYKALKAQIPQIRSLDSIRDQIEMISDAPVRKFFKMYYGMAGKEIGMQYFKFLSKKDEFMENAFLEDMERYAIEVAGERITNITNTTRALMDRAVKKATQEAVEQGLGVEKTRALIQDYLNNSIKPARARAIAQTELITASNRASFKAADATGLIFKKFWSTSGLSNVRDSHLRAEADSVDGISMNEPFSNGLMFPGDPSGPPEEVINCHCTIIQEPVG